MNQFSNVVLSTKNIDDLITDVANEVVSRLQILGVPPVNNSSKEQFSDDLLTRKEVMELLSISGPTLWRWEKEGKMPSHGKGSKRYYKRSEVLDSLNRLS